jgi:hypothetical protein
MHARFKLIVGPISASMTVGIGAMAGRITKNLRQGIAGGFGGNKEEWLELLLASGWPETGQQQQLYTWSQYVLQLP